MSKSISSFMLFLFVFISCSHEENINSKVQSIWETDDRISLTQAPPLIQEWGKSVAVMMNSSDFIGNQVKFKRLKDRRIKEMGRDYGLCTDENIPFLNSPEPGQCTGLLIQSGLNPRILTAGHCIASDNFCTSNKAKWVFDFSEPLSINEANKTLTFNPDNIYSCKRVVEWIDKDKDFGIIELDRPIYRFPLPISHSDQLHSQKHFVIGSPLGVPLAYSPNGEVFDSTDYDFGWMTEVKPEYLYNTTLDILGGNSGSPTFTYDGYVRGTLIRGPIDFTFNSQKKCFSLKKCKAGDTNILTHLRHFALQPSNIMSY